MSRTVIIPRGQELELRANEVAFPGGGTDDYQVWLLSQDEDFCADKESKLEHRRRKRRQRERERSSND